MKYPATSSDTITILLQHIKKISSIFEDQQIIIDQLESQIDQLGLQIIEDNDDDDHKMGNSELRQ